MLEQIIYNDTTYWLLGTAIIFTFVGRYMAMKALLGAVIESTIETLIDDGYIKTKGSGENIELIKHSEWQND